MANPDFFTESVLPLKSLTQSAICGGPHGCCRVLTPLCSSPVTCDVSLNERPLETLWGAMLETRPAPPRASVAARPSCVAAGQRTAPAAGPSASRSASVPIEKWGFLGCARAAPPEGSLRPGKRASSGLNALQALTSLRWPLRACLLCESARQPTKANLLCCLVKGEI